MAFRFAEVFAKLEMDLHVYTVVWVLRRVGCVAGNIKDRTHDGYVGRIRRVCACAIIRSVSNNLVVFLDLQSVAVVPSHLARSPRLIGSSLGGLSLGGSLGAKFFGFWTCTVSAMADLCGKFRRLLWLRTDFSERWCWVG